MGLLDRWDRRNDRWAEASYPSDPGTGLVHPDEGPRWAYVLSAVPFVGIVGDIALAVHYFKARRRDRAARRVR